MSKNTYILDPGHGAISPLTGQYVTPGKRSQKWGDGSVYYEGVGNREIAKIVAEKLKALGIKYAFTVTPSEWEDVALSTRVSRANALISKTPCVLISIHSNASANASANGFEVFTSPGQTLSDKYAELWFKNQSLTFTELKGRPDNSDMDKDKEERFTMIMSPKCPSFLVETMFHTNEKECKILMSPEGKERIANAIVKTIQQIELL